MSRVLNTRRREKKKTKTKKLEPIGMPDVVPDYEIQPEDVEVTQPRIGPQTTVSPDIWVRVAQGTKIDPADPTKVQPIVMTNVPAETPAEVPVEVTQSKVILPEDIMGPTIIGGEKLDISYINPTVQFLESEHEEPKPIHGSVDVPARPEDLVEPIKPEIAKPHLGEPVEAPPGSWLYGYIPEKREKEK